MAKYRKKPVVIEALQFDGENHDAIVAFAGISINVGYIDRGMTIDTLEGMMTANPGDWIIKGVKGEFYPCKPDIFEATYEIAENSPRS